MSLTSRHGHGKASRNASWSTIASAIANKHLPGGTSHQSGGGHGGIVNSPRSQRASRPNIALLSEHHIQKEQMNQPALPRRGTAGSLAAEQHKPLGEIFPNLESVFSGKCYDPEPVLISENYRKPDWTPVPINDQTIRVEDEEGSGPFNASHEYQSFYHRELSREAAVRMFKKHGSTPGLCVVRDSTRTPGQYALTVWEGKSAVNYRIEFTIRNFQGQYLLSGKTPFRSLGEILLFLNKNSQYFPTAPQKYIPCIPDESKDSLYSEHFVPTMSEAALV